MGSPETLEQVVHSYIREAERGISRDELRGKISTDYQMLIHQHEIDNAVDSILEEGQIKEIDGLMLPLKADKAPKKPSTAKLQEDPPPPPKPKPVTASPKPNYKTKDRNEAKGLIRECLKTKGKEGILFDKLCLLFPKISEYTVSSILKELVKSGEIEIEQKSNLSQKAIQKLCRKEKAFRTKKQRNQASPLKLLIKLKANQKQTISRAPKKAEYIKFHTAFETTSPAIAKIHIKDLLKNEYKQGVTLPELSARFPGIRNANLKTVLSELVKDREILKKSGQTISFFMKERTERSFKDGKHYAVPVKRKTANENDCIYILNPDN